MANQLPGEYPCPKCGSSDAVRKYDDDSAYCFSCSSPLFGEEIGEKAKKVTHKLTMTAEDFKYYPFRPHVERKIPEEIMKFFGVRARVSAAGKVLSFLYPYEGGTFKERVLPKEFRNYNGGPKSLFGKEKFSGAGKRLVIVEGELDVLSVATAYQLHYQKIYPVVGIPSSSSLKAIVENREWIRSFKEIVLCLDMDEPGQKAAREIARIIGFDKVKLAKLPLNDANEILMKKGFKDLINAIFDAGPIIPMGIVSKEALWQSLIEFDSTESFPYPECVAGLNSKTKGMRFGEISLFTSGTSTGKSTMMREIMLHVLETSDHKIGVVSLEESPAETARKLSAMPLRINPANEKIPLETLKLGFDKVFGDDRVILLDHQGSASDRQIVDKLEYMALSGARFLFIDHITILVSEGVESLQGNEAIDKMMNELLRLVKKYPVWIGLVSHLRKAPVGGKTFEEGRMPTLDDIKGSGSIKQVSFDVIGFARDMVAVSEIIRNQIQMRVLKCRFTGLTGDVRAAHYIFNTGRMMAAKEDVKLIEIKGGTT
jgi:twinkle protein